ncbi:hypothetical protein, conserved [Trypanosoma brucei gambiense DAL972]|uniref:Uncharacterized protein n=1 Tax=Trypanosoma brucei gambiense (strain MHOM/CI/86/DAL972) TaxID=679716 RepID=C9ZW38_TRYB9|nr:hypothetical protein, conserved [Trypanosoma brucei gambiense DAL972]CBH13627.1 hypothetical protein, conserved [Trypanosoma brucei gambiense DAL972]|eukprot:XP_011775903.1 hypothetical protein, conserved [Trypanosoma brucei gambiense DAL972]
MDFVFPVFVPASDCVVEKTVTEKKSLWELVIEASSNRTYSRTTDADTVYCARPDEDANAYGKPEGDDSDYEKEASAAIAPTSRSSWIPTPYMTKNLLSSGFVSQFCTLNAIECSARVPPPPCLRLEDLQLPPVALKRLREQLLQSLRKKFRTGSVVKSFHTSQKTDEPDLRELREIVLNGATGEQEGKQCSEEERVECMAAGGDDGEGEDRLVLTALQQVTLTSMLLGHHTVSVAPHGTGKKTAGLIATAALTLARECDTLKESLKKEEQQQEVKEESEKSQTFPPLAPRAIVLLSSFRELQRCNRWLQYVFTAEAFVPLTFRRGTAQLVKLPVLFAHPPRRPVRALLDHPVQPPLDLLPQQQPVPQEPEDRQEPRVLEEEARERQESLRESDHRGHKRLRELSDDCHHRRGHRYRSRSRSLRQRHRHHHHRRDRHRGSSRSVTGREVEGRKQRYRDCSEDRKRRRRSHSGRGRRERSRRRYRSRSLRSDSHERNGGRRGTHKRDPPRPHSSHSNVAEGTRKPSDQQKGDDAPHSAAPPLPSSTPPEPAQLPVRQSVLDDVEEVPHCLQQHVPILLATHQSFADALQEVRGQAEMLPFECIRVVCISDADRVAQPNSQASLLPSWWVSFSNAVDVDCQFIVSASRMLDEVDTWLRETVLNDTPNVINRYRQRDDTVWLAVQHIIEVVHVDEPTDYRQSRQSYEGVEGAKLDRLADIVTRHFSPPHGTGAADGAAGNVADASSSHHASSMVGRLIVMVSSRKEQEAVFSHLFSLLQSQSDRVRCTCQWEEFQQGNADLLVAYDWMVTIAHDHSEGESRSHCPISVVVNYSFPRMLLAPGKEESLLECLVIRTRSLLCGYAPAGVNDHPKDQRSGVFGREGNITRMPLSVLTILTARQVHGRLGRLLQQRAQALTSE